MGEQPEGAQSRTGGVTAHGTDLIAAERSSVYRVEASDDWNGWALVDKYDSEQDARLAVDALLARRRGRWSLRIVKVTTRSEVLAYAGLPALPVMPEVPRG